MASSSRAPPGAWNAHKGQRILTEAQRERKRERDRITKRQEKARLQQRLQQLEQTKDSASKRIEELESQVNTLKKLCAGHNTGSDSSVAAGSAAGNSPSNSEVPSTSSVNKCVPVGPLPLQSRGNPISVKQQETGSVFGNPMGSHTTSHYELPYVQANSPSINTNYFSAVPHPSYILTSSTENYHRPGNDISSPNTNGGLPYRATSTPQGAMFSHPPTPAPSITIPSVRNLIEVPTPHSRNVSVINQFLDPRGFDITNDFNTLALSRKYLKDHPGIVTDPVVAEDFIIRAVLGGWERAFREHRGPICPIWQILQLADEYMWNNTPHPVRFAYLLQHHRLFLYFLLGREIPKWLIPRESQRIYAHEPIIAFNSHPYIRDRLVMLGESGKRRTMINKSWIMYNRCAQFIFPASQTLLNFDPSRGLYKFTDIFQSSWLDINNFQFDPEYFYEHPYLVEDCTLDNEMRWPLVVYVEGQDENGQQIVRTVTGYDSVGTNIMTVREGEHGRIEEVVDHEHDQQQSQTHFPLKMPTTATSATLPSSTLAPMMWNSNTAVTTASYETPFAYGIAPMAFGNF